MNLIFYLYTTPLYIGNFTVVCQHYQPLRKSKLQKVSNLIKWFIQPGYGLEPHLTAAVAASTTYSYVLIEEDACSHSGQHKLYKSLAGAVGFEPTSSGFEDRPTTVVWRPLWCQFYFTPKLTKGGFKYATKILAPQVGFEPTAYRLTAECSTIELLGLMSPTDNLFIIIWAMIKIKFPYYLVGLMVPEIGLEPIRCCHRGILSPLRLPIPPHRQGPCCWNCGCCG